MWRSKLVLVVVCAAFMACAQQEMTRREQLLEQQVVQDRVNGWVKAWNNAMVDSVAGFYHQVPEVRVLWADGRRSDGGEAVTQAIRDFYVRVQYMNFVVSELEVEVLGKSTAIATFRHSTDIVQTNNQRRPVAAGQGVLLWVKDPQDGVWKIHTSQLAVSQPSRN